MELCVSRKQEIKDRQAKTHIRVSIVSNGTALLRRLVQVSKIVINILTEFYGLVLATSALISASSTI